MMKLYCYSATIYNDGRMFVRAGYVEAECKSDAENDIRNQVKESDTIGTLVIMEIPREVLINHLYSIT